MGPVIVIVVLVVLAWLFLAVPARRRQRAHAAMQDGVVDGDEIITAGGMHALVREAGEAELRVEIAPGVVVTLDRRAVAAVATWEEPSGELAEDGRAEVGNALTPADMDDEEKPKGDRPDTEGGRPEQAGPEDGEEEVKGEFGPSGSSNDGERRGTL